MREPCNAEMRCASRVRFRLFISNHQPTRCKPNCAIRSVNGPSNSMSLGSSYLSGGAAICTPTKAVMIFASEDGVCAQAWTLNDVAKGSEASRKDGAIGSSGTAGQQPAEQWPQSSVQKIQHSTPGQEMVGPHALGQVGILSSSNSHFHPVIFTERVVFGAVKPGGRPEKSFFLKDLKWPHVQIGGSRAVKTEAAR